MSFASGDVGSYPVVAQTGVGDMTINGTNHFGDEVTQLAKEDLRAAFTKFQGLVADTLISHDLGGLVLSPGVYASAAAIGLTGSVLFDSQGNPDAVFVVRTDGALNTAAASGVYLLNGAQARNVWWIVGASATLGATTALKGTIIALTAITLGAGVKVEGGVLALDAAVTLDSVNVALSFKTAGSCVY